MFKIDKLMWVFCKNECVKQKKQVLDVQNGKFFASTDAIALRMFTENMNLQSQKIISQQRVPFLCGKVAYHLTVKPQKNKEAKKEMSSTFLIKKVLRKKEQKEKERETGREKQR